MSHDAYQSCIEACVECAKECNHCAAECLKEDNPQFMAHCIELNRECAIVCFSAAQLMSIGGMHASLLCSKCEEICDACAFECARYDNDHCQRCADACRRCAAECHAMAEEHA
ncbi:MAG TPA: four-helix bundle copper-binding protein [Chryseosolibacter sp.]|nr:four-helix bundle copper-binding protein [Chryseosolibacter sp.]